MKVVLDEASASRQNAFALSGDCLAEDPFLSRKEGTVMRRLFVGTAMAAFFLSLPGRAAAEEQEFKGRITDDMCGAEHMMEGMSAKECAEECVKMGAKYALYVPADKKAYGLDQQNEAKKFAGDSVVVKGTLDQEGNIKVSSIQKQQKTK
ncbi:MAG: hypothetical protein ACE5JI_16340 [Acidobacteriota bacterium]